MNKILKKLLTWKEAGLISDAQFQSIKDYEEEHKPKNLAAYTIITLGAIVICIGIISLIASNWEEIGDITKLLIDFTILMGLSYAIYLQKETKKVWLLETLIVSYFLLILASIGLISQIYNTGGEFYQACFFWCVITLPLVLYSTGRITTHLWLIAAIFSFTSMLLDTVDSFKEEEILLSWVYSILPLLLLVFSFPLRAAKQNNLHTFGNTTLFWSIFGFLSGTIFFSFLGLIEYQDSKPTKDLVQFLLFVSCALAGASFYFANLQHRKISILLVFGLTIYIVLFASHIFQFNSKTLDVVFFVLIWFAAGFIFHLLENTRLFEFAIVIIGLRFLVAYFQLFASLLLTAFGLIFSGVFIITVCILYIKNREKITQKIGELI